MTHPSPYRMPKDELYLRIADLVAQQATCRRRAVGCVLVDHRHRILSTGYNGVPAGAPHCLSSPCAGATQKSGEGLHLCEAIHAEQNAILLLRDPYAVRSAYVTTFPCDGCIKLLLGTSCERIVFAENYAHPAAADRWALAGREAIWMPKGQWGTASN